MEKQNILKRKVALFSLIISVILVIIKIVVAYYSNSIGVFSEALNNGLDIITVVITFIAVRAATKPPDKDHTYGHGKYENISALFEIVIITLLCFFIIYKSIQRLTFRDFELKLNIYVFLALAMSILINIFRLYLIGRIIRKYNSFAFKAEFINYLSDITSSLIVIGGLLFANYGFYIADPIASIVVALIIIGFSVRLLVKIIKNLLDYIPKEITEKIASILNSFPEIKSINKLQIHEVGEIKFLNLDLSVGENIYLTRLESLKEKIKNKILEKIKDSEIVIEIKPSISKDNIDCLVKEIVLSEKGIHDLHNIFIYKVNDKFDISIHVEMSRFISLKESEELTSKIEEKIKEKNDKVRNVYIHIEEALIHHDPWEDITVDSEELILKIKENISKYILPNSCHKFTILQRQGFFNISFHCRLDKNMDIKNAHFIVSEIEKSIKNLDSKISEVSIHVEPI